MTLHRPTVFWLFVLGFFLTVASVLFYTYGYRFSPTRGIFVYTGSLTIDANPDAISIKIDGEQVPDNQLGVLNKASHVAGLAPGEYQIEVTSAGYHTWKKKVIIESGKSTEFWNVLLTKENPENLILPDTAGSIRAFPSPKQNLIALAKKQNNELTITTYDTADEVGKQVFSLANADLLDNQSDGLEWSPEGEKLLIPVERAGKREYYVVDVETTESTLINIFTADTPVRKFTRWHPSERATLVYLDNRSLFKVDTRATPWVAESMYQNVVSYDISSGNAYTLTPNGILMKYPLDSSNYQDERGLQITTSPITINEGTEYFVVIYDDSRVTLLETKSGTFWLHDKENSLELTKVATGIKGTQFSDDGKKLIYYSDTDISVAYLRDWEVQPVRLAGTHQQIIRLSTPIRQVQWTKDYEHIFYASGSHIQFAELDNRDYRNIGNFLTLPTPPLQLFSRFEEDRVYVISESGLSAMDFPEAVTLFGFGN
jgi:Tol biopolymer transport system component